MAASPALNARSKLSLSSITRMAPNIVSVLGGSGRVTDIIRQEKNCIGELVTWAEPEDLYCCCECDCPHCTCADKEYTSYRPHKLIDHDYSVPRNGLFYCSRCDNPPPTPSDLDITSFRMSALLANDIYSTPRFNYTIINIDDTLAEAALGMETKLKCQIPLS